MKEAASPLEPSERTNPFFFNDFIYLFKILFIHETQRKKEREREREAETQPEGEAGSMQGA